MSGRVLEVPAYVQVGDGPGTCVVLAYQPGNAIYNPAPTVSQGLNVRR